MTRSLILVYDDRPEVKRSWTNRLKSIRSVKSEFDVKDIQTEEFVNLVIQLEERRSGVRRGKPPEPDWRGHLFDSVDILFLDYDLLDPEENSYLDGENVAYLARCFSRCGLIVGINQFGPNTFDLHLKGHPESFADWNLGGQQIDNGGLWLEPPWDGFRPWHWPLLPEAAKALEKRAGQLMDHLNDGILEFLGFPAEVAAIMPRPISEFIEGSVKADEVTFRDFVLNSGNGLKRRDASESQGAIDDLSIARIGAARIAKWLERLVLPGQDILVDAPHMISRFPSLLKDDKDSIETWNRVVSFNSVSALGLHYRKINDSRLKVANWLARQAWFWYPVSNNEKIYEVVRPWASQHPNWVFCEDISRFMPREATREFVTDLHSPFIRRFVVDHNSEKGKRYAEAVRDVNYRPLAFFSA